MPDLRFAVEGAAAVAFAASPQLALTLRVTNAPADQAVHAMVLRCQVRIAAPERTYAPDEAERLSDLFGVPSDWARTLQTLLWAHVTVSTGAFVGSTAVALPLPCAHDFSVAAAKYFYALAEGDVPLTLLFAGTVFYAGADDALQVAQIPWSAESAFRLPVKTFRDTMERYYPNSVALTLRRDVFELLYQHKRARGLPTFEQALEGLLAAERGR